MANILGDLGRSWIILRIMGEKALKYFQGAEDFIFRDLAENNAQGSTGHLGGLIRSANPLDFFRHLISVEG